MKTRWASKGRQRSVVIVSTSDQSPLLRMRAALAATTVAEFFAAQGKHVLLVLDSLTRFAMAAREIGLAAGEPPTAKGYTPSVFTRLARLVERTGQFRTGSITAFYTVLMEGDDQQDPLVDAVRSLLDGHVVLSRALAAEGWYPPVEVLDSISRLMPAVAGPAHREQAALLRRLMAVYARSEDLVRIGAYKPGADPDLDRALAGSRRHARLHDPGRPRAGAFCRLPGPPCGAGGGDMSRWPSPAPFAACCASSPLKKTNAASHSSPPPATSTSLSAPFGRQLGPGPRRQATGHVKRADQEFCPIALPALLRHSRPNTAPRPWRPESPMPRLKSRSVAGRFWPNASSAARPRLSSAKRKPGMRFVAARRAQQGLDDWYLNRLHGSKNDAKSKTSPPARNQKQSRLPIVRQRLEPESAQNLSSLLNREARSRF